MNYAIIGTGREGQALAPIAKAIGQTIIPESLQKAVKSDIVILASPSGTQKEVAKAAESWQGKIVIDATSAYGVSPKELGILPSSVVISQVLPGAKLVKAFNHSGSRKWSHRVRKVPCAF